MDKPISQETLHELRRAAEAAWGDDTRHTAHKGHPCSAVGQCYVTAAWLQSLYGGHVARKDGHYFWLSPHKFYAVDLTGDRFVTPPTDPSVEGHRLDDDDEGIQLGAHHATWRPGPVLHKKATDPLFAGWEVVPEAKSNARTALFVRRANRALEALKHGHKLAIDFGGDALPAQEPQYVEDHGQGFMHDDPFSEPEPKTYNVIYANGELHLSADDDHDTLSRHALIEPNHTGPFAAGFVTVDNVGRANWQLRSNIALHGLMRVLKEYGKTVGWEWGGLTDATGQPINDDFAPTKSQRLFYAWFDDYEHLYMAKQPWALAAKVAQVAEEYDDQHPMLTSGTIEVEGKVAKVSGFADRPWLYESLKEWADDEGFMLMAGDNVIKRIEDLQQENLWSPTDNEPENTQFFNQPQRDERSPGGVYKCPDCGRIFPSYFLYIQHRQDEEPVADSSPDMDPQHSIDALPDMDKPFPANFTPMDYNNGMTNMGRVAVIRTSPKESSRVQGADPYYLRHDYDEHWTAYMGGWPVGAAVLEGDTLTYIHSPIGHHVTDAILSRIQRAHDDLYFQLAYWEKSDGTRTSGWEVEEDFDLLMRMGFLRTAKTTYKWSKKPDPSRDLEGAVPFIYDVEEDNIVTGHPGARHSDIIGRFTPGGIVEGLYEPGGKVIIRSITNMPYTVRHMLELWYYQHPELVIKSVHLRDDAGQDTKLATTTKRSAQEVGQYIANLVASDDVAYRAYTGLRDAGGKVYVVGGAVRDALLGKDPKDIDFMVTGLPPDAVDAALRRLPGRVDLTGKDFGVYRYREGDKGEVEIALPRRERSTGAGHQDFEVQADHTMTPQEDFYRRDFTPNAMGVELDTAKLIDPFGGADDIAAGRFRALNDRSLHDDPLRTVRAVVLRGKHGLEPDDATRRQMGEAADAIQHLPAERIQAELDKLFQSKYPDEAVRLAHETGVLKHLFPEVASAFGYNQNNPHHEQELGEHLLSVLKHATALGGDPDLALAALLHDIGKPASRWNECVNCTALNGDKAVRPNEHSHCADCGAPLSGHYYEHRVPNPDGSYTAHGAQHEDVGAEMARERLTALKYPAKRIDRVTDLIRHHMFPGFNTEKGARRFLNRVGDHADDLLILRQADQGGKTAYPTDEKMNVDEQRAHIDAVRARGEAVSQSNLAVNGHDIIQHLGIKPGPQVGQILKRLTEEVVDDPTLNERETLLQRAQGYGLA